MSSFGECSIFCARCDDLAGAPISRGLTLGNMTNVTLARINVTGYQSAFLTQTNVQGSGLKMVN